MEILNNHGVTVHMSKYFAMPSPSRPQFSYTLMWSVHDGKTTLWKETSWRKYFFHLANRWQTFPVNNLSISFALALLISDFSCRTSSDEGVLPTSILWSIRIDRS